MECAGGLTGRVSGNAGFKPPAKQSAVKPAHPTLFPFHFLFLPE